MLPKNNKELENSLLSSVQLGVQEELKKKEEQKLAKKKPS